MNTKIPTNKVLVGITESELAELKEKYGEIDLTYNGKTTTGEVFGKVRTLTEVYRTKRCTCYKEL